MLSVGSGYNSPYTASRPDPPKERIMNFVSIRIITADIKRLARFYEQITGISVTMYTEDFGELKTPACTLAIGSTRTLQLFGGDVARPAAEDSQRRAIDQHDADSAGLWVRCARKEIHPRERCNIARTRSLP